MHGVIHIQPISWAYPNSYKTVPIYFFMLTKLASFIMKPIILSFLAFWLGVCSTNAQSTFEGRVLDKESRQPLEAASVTLLQGEARTLVGYALTDANGRFAIKSTATGSLQLSASYLGYQTEVRPATPGTPLTFELSQEAFALKEVQIRGGRIYGRQDTVKYDFTRFASEKDMYVKDVLKKLPGINVEDDGRIKYNGKDISNFYVEGLDVSGGRYNLVNNNLRANAVKVAEIIENHQPVKSLQNKVFTDDVALNLKLKPEARAQWIVTATGGLGYGDELLRTATLNALQLGKEKQTVYTYKGNNTGVNLSPELSELAVGNMTDRMPDRTAPAFLSPAPISAPLDEKRVLFNDSHLLSANRLYKLDEDRQLRLQLNYLHEQSTQQWGDESRYYFVDDTITTAERQDYRLRTDRLNAELNYENNGATNYLRNRFLLSGAWSDGLSSILSQGDEEAEARALTQQIRSSQLSARNFFTHLHTGEHSTWGIRSFLRYSYLPASIRLQDDQDESGTHRTDMNVHDFYTDNSLYWLRKKNGVSLQLTAGLRGDLSSVGQENTPPLLPHATTDERYDANGYAVYLLPQLEWEKGYLRVIASAQAQWKELPGQSYAKFLVDPRLSIRYQFGPRWRLYLSGNLNTSTGGLADFYPSLYRRDYRTWVQRSGIVPETTRQQASFYAEYKNTIQEFFWTLSLSQAHSRHNVITEQDYADGEFLISTREYRNSSDSYALNTVVSKGFYDWNLKTSLEVLLSRSEGKQSNQGEIQTYRYDYLRFQPRIIWTASSFLQAEYQGSFACSSSKIGDDTELSALWNLTQRFTLNFGWKNTELVLSGEHYYNDINAHQHLTNFLADASMVYKLKKWRLTASVTNLFNQKRYSYTAYSNVQSSTSWIHIRPREFLLTVQYQF